MSRDRARARAIVARLSAGSASSDEVFTAFAELDALPADVVREALEPWVGPAPDIDRLDDVTRRVHGLPPRPLRLRTASVAKDADVLDLGPVAEQQLRLAGKSWDGVDREPEERLDEEVEGNFAGTLERRVLADAEAPNGAALFDIIRYHEGDGVVFRAGTADPIGLIADGRVEMTDRRARVAIEEALAAPVAPQQLELELGRPAAPEPEVEAAPPPKKKRAAAKKPAAASTASTKKKTATTKKKAAAAPKKKAAASTKKTSTPKKKTAATKKR